jgi:Tol biopolymer transport system component
MEEQMLPRINGGWIKAAVILALVFSIELPGAFAQFGDYFGFGKNKVQYKNFKWSVIHTEHFDIYFYEDARQSAMDAAQIAERSYAYLSEVLDYKFKQKIPLLLYSSHNDFQQTNAIQSYISEGTQGVTESLKGRMILPITGSYAQFVHVLTHEMVHAFQFDILMAEGPADLVRRFNPPLWFIEGMAEYLSVGMDNITRMWMRDAVLNNTLLSIPEMAYVFDIRVYRMGQAIWYYVGERYGKEVVGRIFKTARATGDLGRAFKAHTGLDLEELSKRWQDDARTRYLPENVVLKKPGEVAKPITDPCVDCTSINIVPAISPDGKELAYIGDKNYMLHMFLRDLDTKKEAHSIVKSGTSESYEVLRYFDTSMNWSPDAKYFSFIAKAGANDAIYIVEAQKREVVDKLTFKNITSMTAPSWSPDGNRLVFTGLQGGISEIFMVDRDGANLKKLTNDRYSQLHPQWSPDGKKIAFTTDQGPNTKIDSLIFGDYNIALYDFDSGNIELLTETGGNYINPIWSKASDEIFFVSDMNGIPNIYSINLQSRDVYRITNFITGVSGIITETPAITLAPQTGRLAFSAFSNGGWYIYTLDEYKKEKVDLPVVAVLDSLEDPNQKYREYSLPDSAEFALGGYKSRLSPDLIVGGGAFASNVGFAGQTAFLFSDMLGDKTLIIQAALYGDPLESTIITTYYNQKRRLNWAITGFQFREDFGVFTAPNQGQVVSQVYRGLGVGLSLPFNTFTRVEFGSNLYFINEDVAQFDFATGQTTSRDAGNAIYSSVDASLVRDSAGWGIAAPITGTRARFTAQQNVGNLRYTLLLGDYRKYFAISIPRYSIAYRFTGGTIFGRNERFFRIGGPFSFRGVDFGELIGTKIFFQNLEFRFPMFPFLPMQYDFLTAVAFFDAANTWGLQGFDFAGNPVERGFDVDDVLTSYGLGIRFNLGGLLVLRWDFPLKKETGQPSVFFSIGLDY